MSLDPDTVILKCCLVVGGKRIGDFKAVSWRCGYKNLKTYHYSGHVVKPLRFQLQHAFSDIIDKPNIQVSVKGIRFINYCN